MTKRPVPKPKEVRAFTRAWLLNYFQRIKPKRDDGNNLKSDAAGLPKFISIAFQSALVGAVLFGLSLQFLTTEFLIAAVVAFLISIISLVLSALSRAAILWATFVGCVGGIINMAVPGLSLKFEVDLWGLSLNGGYGGEPTAFAFVAMLLAAILTFVAAIRVQ